MSDQETSLTASDMASIIFEDDFARIEKEIPTVGKRKRKRMRLIQSPEGDRQISQIPRNLNLKGKTVKSPKKVPSRLSKESQKRSKEKPVNVPLHSGRYAEGTSKNLTKRPSMGLSSITSKRAHPILFAKHITKIKRPPSWNTTVFAGPNKIFMNFKRIRKRQEMAFEKKVYQLSKTRAQNENNNASEAKTTTHRLGCNGTFTFLHIIHLSEYHLSLLNSIFVH